MPLSCRATRRLRVSSQIGMTLIEIVIAVGILGIVLSVAYKALTQVMQTKQLLDDERDSSMIANAVLGRLTREIALAVPQKLIPEQTSGGQISSSDIQLKGTPGKGAGGSADSITFMAKNAGQFIPDGKTQAGIIQLTYRAMKDPESKGAQEDNLLSLIRDELPDIRPLEKAFKNRITFPITDRLVQLKFRYFDGVQDTWRDTWGDQNSKGLPALVKLTVALKSNQGKVTSYSTTVKVGLNLERF
jgi:prepilin-type N-terminal cleavage/methylation domain-containing protein